jgi:hypothetical protein
MYERRNDHRCVECGETWKPKKVANEVPVRPKDSNCGDVLPNSLKGYYRPLDHVPQCVDGSPCSFEPKEMKELDDGRYIAVCAHHKE